MHSSLAHLNLLPRGLSKGSVAACWEHLPKRQVPPRSPAGGLGEHPARPRQARCSAPRRLSPPLTSLSPPFPQGRMGVEALMSPPAAST